MRIYQDKMFKLSGVTLLFTTIFSSPSPVLSEITDNPAVTETVEETVNQNINPLNSVMNQGSGSGNSSSTNSVTDNINSVNGAIDQGNTIVDTINGKIDNTPSEANGAVNEAIDSVLDSQTQGEIGEAIGSVQQASGLVSRVIGLGDKIRGILTNFNLDQILDAINLDLNEITGNVYTVPGSKGAASDPLADIEAGALGLPGIDEVDETIEESGSTALMEALAGKQEGGGRSGRVYMENLYRINQAEQIADKTALSRQGQEKLASNSIATDDALKTSTAMMEDSEQQDVSQNVLRNISVQAHEQTVHTGLLALDAQLRARDDSVRNVLMGRTLMEIQAERVSEQRRNASAYSGVIASGGLFYLPGLGDEQQPDQKEKQPETK
jgi:hypothetical protein